MNSVPPADQVHLKRWQILKLHNQINSDLLYNHGPGGKQKQYNQQKGYCAALNLPAPLLFVSCDESRARLSAAQNPSSQSRFRETKRSWTQKATRGSRPTAPSFHLRRHRSVFEHSSVLVLYGCVLAFCQFKNVRYC